MGDNWDVCEFVQSCQSTYPSGIAVDDFTGKIREMFGIRATDILGSKAPGMSFSVLDKLEEFKSQGRLVPHANAIKIVQHIQRKLVQEMTVSLEPALMQIGDGLAFERLLQKKNIVWIEGGKPQSLQDLTQGAKEGAALWGLSSKIIDSARKLLFIEQILTASSEQFSDFSPSFICSAQRCLYEQFLEQMPQRSSPSSTPFTEEMELFFQNEKIDISEIEENPSVFDEETELFFQNEKIDISEIEENSSVFDEKTELFFQNETIDIDQLDEVVVAEEMKSVYANLERSHGSLISRICQIIVDADPVCAQNFQATYSKAHKIADELRFDLEEFFEQYDEDVARYVLSRIEFYPGDVFLEKLCTSAEAVIEAHSKKMQYLEELFDEASHEFAIDPSAKPYIFYTKTLWPGYESEGEFSLALPGEQRGRFTDFDFIFTEEVEEKMREMWVSADTVIEHGRGYGA